jgi:hypothetical protein
VIGENTLASHPVTASFIFYLFNGMKHKNILETIKYKLYLNARAKGSSKENMYKKSTFILEYV